MAVTTDLELANLALARLGQDAITSIDDSTRDSKEINRWFDQNREYCQSRYNWVSLTKRVHMTRAGKATVTNVTQAAPPVVTVSGHGFLDGDLVTIEDAGGMTDINDGQYVVYSHTTDTMTLYTVRGSAADATGYSAYTSGGYAYRHPGANWSYLYDLPSGCLKVLALLDEDFGGNEKYLWVRERDMLYAGLEYAGVEYIRRDTDPTHYEEQLVELIAARLAWLVSLKISDGDTRRQAREDFQGVMNDARMQTGRNRKSAPAPEVRWESIR